MQAVTDPFNRDIWQCRLLAHTRDKPIGMVALSILSHNYDDAVLAFLHAVFPGNVGVEPPALVSAARISKSGGIVADFMDAEGNITKNALIYRSETALRDAFRRLADEMQLADADRIELFKAVQRWVVADTRLDPTMNPQDPDAKRLTVH